MLAEIVLARKVDIFNKISTFANYSYVALV